MKTQRRKLGDVVKIPLGDGTHTYACVLPDAMFAFFDLRTTEEIAVENVLKQPVLFFVAVMNHAVNSGRWQVVGHSSVGAGLQPPPRFIQDALNKNSFSIYENGQIRPATREECAGLERAAVWEPEHAEERIRDYYAGRKNRFLEEDRRRVG